MENLELRRRHRGPGSCLRPRVPAGASRPEIWRQRAVANYPPLAIDELAVIGRVYWFATGGAFPDGPALTMTLRARSCWRTRRWRRCSLSQSGRLGGCGRRGGAPPPMGSVPPRWSPRRWATSTSSSRCPRWARSSRRRPGRPIVAGVLFGAALMTKPQALFVGSGRRARPLECIGGPAAGPGAGCSRRRRARRSLSVVVALPVVFAGTTLNMMRAMGSLVRHDMLAGNALNLWWIVGYANSSGDGGRSGGIPRRRGSLPNRADLLSAGRLVHQTPRLVGGALTCAATVWALGLARGARDLGPFRGAGRVRDDCVPRPLGAGARESFFRRDSPACARGDIAAGFRPDPDRARHSHSR